jgi:hypothetical protein
MSAIVMPLRRRPRVPVPMLDHKQEFWRKEDPILNDKGEVIKGGFWEPQRNWWSLPNFIKSFVAGYGSGKTFIGAKRDIAQCLLNAPAPQLVVSPSYKIAKRTIIPVIRALCQGKAVRDPTFTWSEHRTDFEFTIKHGPRIGTIWIASGDEPDSLKGPTVGSAHIDEPFVQEKEVLDQCIARVRDPRAKRKEITLTGTPEQLNWGYDICAGDEKEDYDVGVVHASTHSNRALADDYAKRMESAYTDRATQAFVDGLFVNLSKGVVYYGFTNLNVVQIPDPGGELCVGMDFNVNPMACCVFWVYGNHMHVIAEHEFDNADTPYVCQVLHEKYRFLAGPRQGECRIKNVYPDPAGNQRHTSSPGGKTDFHYIQEAGFIVQARRSHPAVRDRENAVNGKLGPMMGEPTLTFEPSCKRLVKYCRIYTHENKNKPHAKAMSHLLDSLGYPVEYLFPVVRPIVEVRNFQGA